MATDLFDPAKIDSAVNDAFKTRPTSPVPPVQQARVQPANPSSVNLTGLDENLSAALTKAQEEYRRRFGAELPITSGVRTRADQEQLFREAQAGKPNVFMPLDPSKYPGQQVFHTDAIDIPTSVPESFLNEFGIHRPLGKKDPVHAVLMPQSRPAQPAAQPANRTSAQLSVEDLMKPEAINAAVSDVFSTAPPPTKTEKVTGSVGDKVRSFLRGSAALADTLYGVVPGVAGMVTYAGARAAGQTPEQAGQTQARVTGAIERPVGKAFGVTQTPEYKGEASQRAMEAIGKFVGETAESISNKTGIPVPEVEYYLNLGMMAPAGLRGTRAGAVISREAGLAADAAKAAAGKVVEGAAAVTPAPVRNVVRATVETALPGTTRAPARPAGQLGAAGVLTEPPGVELRRNAPTLEQQYQADRQAAAQGQTPVQPQPGVGTARPTAPDAPFTEIKYAETGLPLPEQHARAQTLRRVLGEDYQADLAAIEGKGKERATNYTVSNTDTPQGNFLKDRFADEQRRLAQYADQRIRDTGGTIGLDESAVYKRGNTILKPLQDLQTYFDDATRKIYADRDAIAAQVPVEANNISRVLGDESLWKANTETIGLRDISLARMKQLGMIDKDGNLLPTNAKTAESFRQFLNENWDRKSNNFHKQLKAAVDEDVLANLDTNTPLYKEARGLVELRKNTLDNPNGISRILDAEGPKGINRKVDIEKISQNIIDMPVEQFTHVVDTLRNVPPQLKPQADKALSEIKAQFANRIADQKTPRQLTKYMNDNREVMNRVFTPDEINNLRDYHNAVHILATDTGYKGAAVQAINVEKKLARKVGEQVVSKGAALGAETMTGGQTYGAAALMTNEALSQRFAARQARAQAAAEKKAFEQMQTRFVPIGDLLPQNQTGVAGTPIRNVGQQGGARGQNIVNNPLERRIEPTFDFTIPGGLTDLEVLNTPQYKRKK